MKDAVCGLIVCFQASEGGRFIGCVQETLLLVVAVKLRAAESCALFHTHFWQRMHGKGHAGTMWSPWTSIFRLVRKGLLNLNRSTGVRMGKKSCCANIL